MSKLKITATGDIPDEHINSLVNDIGPEKCHGSLSKVMLLSTEPPSYIEIIGSLINWKTVFIASTTVFFSTLSKRLAEDLYDNKKAIGDVLFSPIKSFARTLVNVIKETPRNSFVKVKIAAPDGVQNPAICFLDESEEEMAFKLSCVFAVGDKMIEKLVEVAKEYKNRITPPMIFVAEMGEVTVECYAGQNNDHIVFTIPLIEPI